ncbi:MAG: phage portal protein [Alphaproteobacteria bacterium]
MRRWWPFVRRETRQAAGYTAMVQAARADYIAGRAGTAELTATAQTCVSWWESGLALADVDGTDLLDARLLALIARALAVRGEFVARIGEDGLEPASDWELSTVAGRPRAYRLSLPDVGGGRTLTALAPEVVHVVVGADVREPWAGTSPLRRAQLSADLLAAVEQALADVYREAPLGSAVLPMPEMAATDRERLTASFRGKRGGVLLRESVSTTAAGGPTPQTDWRPHGLSPNMRDAMAVESLEAARRSILGAFGVLPAMLEPNAAGPMVREGQRHLASWQLQPIARLIGEELTAKTGGDVTLDVLRPLQAYDAGGRARAAQGIVQALAQAKEAGLSDQAVAAAFQAVDWGSPGG